MAQLTKAQRRKAQIDRAQADFKKIEGFEPLASGCRFDVADRMIVIEFSLGTEYRFPPRLAQGLQNASDEELANIEIFPSGNALRWPDLDVDMSIPSIMEGLLGNKAWMSALGAKGGRVTSEAKKVASRKNGAKGGRPKKESATSCH